MAGFYMLAGTLSSELKLEQIALLLKDLGTDSQLEDDELELDSPANLTLRSGFEHEYIVVGDTTESALLLSECERLSKLLQQLQLTHDLEIYDLKNELIHQIDYRAD